tara:strand:+ start:610 stop:1302 length:693 start_codon:yes stop_codon:yes gene_type:complete
MNEVTATAPYNGPEGSGVPLSDDDSIEAQWSKYKIPIISLVAVVVLGVVGFGLFSNHKENKNEEFGEKVYRFTQAHSAKLEKGTYDAASYIASFKVLLKDVDGFEGAFPLLLNSADKVMEKGDLKESLELLQLGESQYSSSNAYKAFFVRIRLAALYEDMGKFNEAYEVLQNLLKSPVKLLESKVYLDLGRVHLKMGEKEKAKTTFQYVIDNGKSGDDVVKMARLYISNM